MRAWWLTFVFVVGPVNADGEWDRLLRDVQKLKEPRYVAWAAGSLVAGGLAKRWDEAYEFNVGFGRLDPMARTFDKFSDPFVMLTFATSFRLFTKFNSISALDTTSSDLLRSIVLTNSLVGPLKFVFNRKRPKGGSGFSFPSGHASNIAAATTVVARHYHGVYRFGAFAASGMVFFSRLSGRHHYFSDVVAGAAVGSLAGWVCSRREFPPSLHVRFSSNRGSTLGIVWSI